MFCGGPSIDLSQVAISSYTGFQYWTPSAIVPLPTNSAATFEVNPNDGDSIKCMKATPWGLFIGKRNSSYILKGYDNNTFYLQTIDPAIGCVSQRTFQMVNGLATWASQKGVYQWPGGGPPVWISEKIDPTYRGIRQLSSNSNSWTISQQPDWQSGFITLNGPSPSWDAVDMPSFVFPSSFTTFNDVSSITWNSGTFTGTGSNGAAPLFDGAIPSTYNVVYIPTATPDNASPAWTGGQGAGASASVSNSTLTLTGTAAGGRATD